jgi:hypothetical protein
MADSGPLRQPPIGLDAGLTFYYHPAAMSYKHGAFALYSLSVLCAMVCATEPAVSPQMGVLVLRNGYVVQGQITQAGDRYLVTLGASDEIRLPVSAVEFQCRTLDEAYQRKRDALDGSSVNQRLELAEWCLRQQLLHRAADQFLAAQLLEPANARVQHLDRRLELAALPPREATPTAQASSATRVSTATQSGPTMVSFDDLDRALRHLPAGTLEQFTNVVQPVLLNRCSLSTCHGQSSKSEYRLLRPASGETLPRRFTQRNLLATLQMTDRRSPDSSPLLKAPTSPHGTAPAAIFGDHDRHQYEALVRWVQLALGPINAAPPATIATPSDNVLRTTDTRAAFWPEELLPENSRDEDSPARTTGDETTGEGNDDLASRSAVKFGARAAQPFVPRDAFDPEIFNRRYFQPQQPTP